MHKLTRTQARRIAVRAQLLDAPRPTDLVAVVHRLTLLQIDPTAAIAPSADLVAWSRLGSAYQPAHLKRALEQDRTLFEHNALVRPMSDLGLCLAGAADWPSHERGREWLRDNDRFRRDVLDLLRSSGPLTSRDIPDTCVVPWASTGWTNDRNVTRMLEFLIMRGEVAIAGRIGRERLWDLRRAGVPGRRRRPVGRGGRAGQERAAARLARHRPAEDDERCRSSRSTSARPASRPWSRASRASGASTRPLLGEASRGARRCCRRSTGSSTTATAPWSCSTSSTSSRCTSPRPSAAGATSRSRSSTTTGWSARSTPSPTARPRCCGCTRSTRT